MKETAVETVILPITSEVHGPLLIIMPFVQYFIIRELATTGWGALRKEGRLDRCVLNQGD